MISLIIFLLLLVVLILVHEFGHFIVAKAFGIRVDEFAIFFPPRLLKWKWGETDIVLGALPFGGYVKIFGEDTSSAREVESPEVNGLAEPKARRSEDLYGRTFDATNFSHRSRFIQAAVIVAGIIFNFLFAWLALSAGYMFGMQTSVDHLGVGQVQNPKVTIVDVLPGSPADKVGIKSNDVVTALQTGTAALPAGANSTELQQFIAAHQDQSMVISVDRAGTVKNFVTKPADGVVAGHKALGVELDDIGILKLSPPLALVQGAVLGWQLTSETATGLVGFFGSIFHGTANFSSVAGPIGIASIGSSAVKQGAVATIIIVSLISINLALINILPIPGLDGGRILFIVIEGIIRRPISEKLATRLTIASFAILALLMLIISYHDVLRIVHPV